MRTVHRGASGIAVALVVLSAGCTQVPRPSLSGVWNPVPSFAWSEPRKPPAAPKVSANAGSVDLDDEPAIDSNADAVIVASEEVVADPFESESAFARMESTEDVTEVAPASESRVQRLRQALTTDVRRSGVVPPDEDALNPLRLRIDALLRKSIQQRDDGQLAEAKSTAQRAADLANEAQIRFLPTELRPSDLLRQLTDALERQESEPPVEEVVTTEETFIEMPAADAPVLTLPVSENGEVPLGRRREAVVPRALGLVAANRPMRLQDTEPSDKLPDSPLIGAIDLPDLDDNIVAPSAVSSATRAQLVDRRRVTGPELKLPESAPEPPSIDPLKPLPKFRSSDRIAKPVEIVPMDAIPLPGVGLRGWSLWGPVLSLSAIAVVVGFGLLGRSLRNRLLAKRSA